MEIPEDLKIDWTAAFQEAARRDPLLRGRYGTTPDHEPAPWLPGGTVYVLISGYPDEGYKEPLGVYSSKELARMADARLPHQDSPGEHREIIELQLDAAAGYWGAA